jgi:hypothetical protein
LSETDVLLGMLESMAPRGNLTIFRFGSGWKIGRGTPDLLNGRGFGQVMHQHTYPTLIDALHAFVADPWSIEEPQPDTHCQGYPCQLHPERRACPCCIDRSEWRVTPAGEVRCGHCRRRCPWPDVAERVLALRAG